MTIRKRFHLDFVYKCPDAVLTCSILQCKDDSLIAFGGHDKKLYLMDNDQNILDQVDFDGWCRCSYSKDITGDGCDEILVGSGDGSFLVLKLDKKNKRLINLKHYKGIEKINACIAGDLHRKGLINLIFGDENNTINIFNSLSSKEPEITLYFDSWVMALDLAYFKIPDVSQQIIGLIAGTKNGHLYFITFLDEEPVILWQKNLYSQINDVKIGDISNDGYNEIIACTNDSYVKILNSTGDKLYYIPIEESRPITCLIEDIDGDFGNEIVIGCADGSLMVYENNRMNSVHFQLKWKTKTRTSIKCICSLKQKGENSISSILYGGYDRTIRKINDFEWGQKVKLEIPIRKFPQQIKIRADLNKEEEFVETPKNMREHIAHIMKHYEVLSSLDFIIDELMKRGYSKSEIDEELELLKENDCLTFGNYDKPVWIFDKKKLFLKKVDVHPIEIESEEDDAEIPQKLEIESRGSDLKEKNQESSDLNQQTSDLKDLIIEYLKINKIVSSKIEFIKNIAEIGFSEEKVEQKINSLKENGLIKYSRSNPRGWSLA